MTLQIPGGQKSKIAQVVNVMTGAVNSGTTLIPWDDTIPQITEGVEYMTLAITPKATANLLKITVVLIATTSIDEVLTVALFQDATANALAAATMRTNAASNGVRVITFVWYMTAGTIASTTFRVRAGTDAAATTTFNGSAAARKLGGVNASSITIEEIAA